MNVTSFYNGSLVTVMWSPVSRAVHYTVYLCEGDRDYQVSGLAAPLSVAAKIVSIRKHKCGKIGPFAQIRNAITENARMSLQRGGNISTSLR